MKIKIALTLINEKIKGINVKKKKNNLKSLKLKKK